MLGETEKQFFLLGKNKKKFIDKKATFNSLMANRYSLGYKHFICTYTRIQSVNFNWTSEKQDNLEKKYVK